MGEATLTNEHGASDTEFEGDGVTPSPVQTQLIPLAGLRRFPRRSSQNNKTQAEHQLPLNTEELNSALPSKLLLTRKVGFGRRRSHSDGNVAALLSGRTNDVLEREVEDQEQAEVKGVEEPDLKMKAAEMTNDQLPTDTPSKRGPRQALAGIPLTSVAMVTPKKLNRFRQKLQTLRKNNSGANGPLEEHVEEEEVNDYLIREQANNHDASLTEKDFMYDDSDDPWDGDGVDGNSSSLDVGAGLISNAPYDTGSSVPTSRVSSSVDLASTKSSEDSDEQMPFQSSAGFQDDTPIAANSSSRRSLRRPLPIPVGPIHRPQRFLAKLKNDVEEHRSRHQLRKQESASQNKSPTLGPMSPSGQEKGAKFRKIRRQLNPRGHKARWRYRIQEDGDNSQMHLPEEEDSDGWDESHEIELHDESDRHSAERNMQRAWVRSKGHTEPSSLTMDSSDPAINSGLNNSINSEQGFFGASGDPVRFRHFRFDQREFRVKPYHCFPNGPVFMTEEELYNDMLRPSENVEFLESFLNANPFFPKYPIQLTHAEENFWGHADDGRVGSLRVEVLGCIGLGRHKPDVSVYLVCGDCAFATDVLQGARSPMWTSKSKRAAVFPIHHAYAKLFVGVFDIMPRHAENDEYLGRVVVDLPALRPNTEYDVTLPLRASSFVYDQRPRGVVRLRFSIHFYAERAAVLSYLSSPVNLAAGSPETEENPTIPCADPKTFRNVAFTVHGKDLPGKYTRKAFQATMREFNLYQINLRFMLQALLMDTMMWLNPILSSYVFSFWMFCVYFQSLRYVPAFFVGILIILLLESYWKYNRDRRANLGYPPLTLQEIFLSIASGTSDAFMEPLYAKKQIRSRPIGILESTRRQTSKDDDIGSEVALMDHREFPFSEKFEYPKRPVEEALVQHHHRNNKRETKAMVGRLSMYVPQDSKAFEKSRTFEDQADERELMLEREESIEFENEDQGEDSGPESDMGMDDEQNMCSLEPEDFEFAMNEEAETPSITESEAILNNRRIPVGPIQDTDLKPKKRIPPQVHLARVENLFNKATMGLNNDRFYFSSLSLRPHHTNIGASGEKDEPDSHLASPATWKRRTQLDEFDKRLGLRLRHPNPVLEITSSFLGPLMRIFRVINFIVRVFFNIGIWRDPFLSFWVLCSQVGLFIILVLFPWRIFFFLTGFAIFGPQNILFRKQIEHVFTKKRKIGDGSSQSATRTSQTGETSASKAADIPRTVTTDGSGGNGGVRGINPDILQLKGPRQKIKELRERIRERRRYRRVAEGPSKSLSKVGLNKQESMTSNGDFSESATFERKSFSATTRTGQIASRKNNVAPREVIVPYSRFRKERFYDWPPEPSVSRATPLRYDDDVVMPILEIPTTPTAGQAKEERTRGAKSKVA